MYNKERKSKNHLGLDERKKAFRRMSTNTP